jgi:hypothetical protein
MAHQLNLGLPVPLNQRQQLVYDAFFAAAEAGLPCPSNVEITRAYNLGCCDSVVSDIVGQLDSLGMIRRHNSTGGRRTVEIVATGKTTSTACSTRNIERITATALAESADSFARALAGNRFEDHPKAKTGKGYPQFYPARHQAYGHEAMC